MQLVFASNNKHKLEEIASLLSNKIQLLTLADIGCNIELPETSDTLEGNALQKANYIYQHYKINCFADDTGLEVEALKGQPGVYSARYAGERKNSNDNMNKLLLELKGEPNRNAAFRTIIALVLNGKHLFFEGKVRGRIGETKTGDKGFGYDPIFIPEDHNQTFAQMDMQLKNTLSHRGMAVKKLAAYLNSL